MIYILHFPNVGFGNAPLLSTTSRKLINITATHFTHVDCTPGAYRIAGADSLTQPMRCINQRPPSESQRRWLRQPSCTWPNHLRFRKWHEYGRGNTALKRQLSHSFQEREPRKERGKPSVEHRRSGLLLLPPLGLALPNQTALLLNGN